MGQRINKKINDAAIGKAKVNWLSQFISLLDMLSRWPSLVFYKIGGWVLALMMLLIAANVFLRAAFNFSILGTVDLTGLMMAIVVTSGLAYVGVIKRHITADVLVTRLPSRPKRIFYLITDFISFGLFVLVSWQSFVNMEAEYSLNMATNILFIPIYPFVALVGFGSALLTIVLLKDFLELLQGSKQ